MNAINISYDPAFVRSFFDEFAQGYYSTSILFFGLDTYIRKRALKEIEWKEGQTICDLMSGSGNNFSLIQKLTNCNCKIIAVDFSEKMNSSVVNFANVILKQEDALNTSVADENVDVVVCSFGVKTLGLEQYKPFADEVYRILKPDASFVIMELSLPRGRFVKMFHRFYFNTFIPTALRLMGNRFNHNLYLRHYIESFGNIAGLQKEFGSFSTARRFSYLGGMVTGIAGKK